MLPIWKDGLLAGVLQVVFEEAHSFDEGEVRTYRLMVGALEYGMLPRPQKPEVVSAFESASHARVGSRYADAVGRIAAGSAIPAETGVQFVSQSHLPESDSGRLLQYEDEIVSDDPTIRDRASDFWWVLTSIIRTRVDRLWSANLWNAAAVASAVMALLLSVWVFHRIHTSNPQIDVSTPALHDGSVGTAAGSPSENNEEPKLAGPGVGTSDSAPRFVRVRVGPNEVDYIADDVTIRQFETRSPRARNRSGVKQVDFGDDVTVRYFANGSLPVSQPARPPEASHTNNQGTVPVVGGHQ
jgi:hypothetical protein